MSVCCNFCGKSISSSGMTNLTNSAQLFNRFSASNAKIKVRIIKSVLRNFYNSLLLTIIYCPQLSCCPSCRKPLPRCSICLMHMGTILGNSKEVQPLLPLPSIVFFTWCQNCRSLNHLLLEYILFIYFCFYFCVDMVDTLYTCNIGLSK